MGALNAYRSSGRRRSFESEFGKGAPRAALSALCELQRGVDSDEALGHLWELVPGYLSRQEDLPGVIAAARIKNERLG